MAILNDIVPIQPFSRRSRYVLVTEEDSRELFTTAMLLHRFSYPVCTARTARQALDMIAVALPSLVITDVVLPGMGGLDLLRVLGTNSHTFGIPVILLMPAGEDGREIENFEIGSHLILQKPLSVEELFKAVQSVMEPTPRSNLRIQTALPVTINKTALDGSRGECATCLSSQGMYVRTFKYHARDEKLSVQFPLGDQTINADATVLYTLRPDAGPNAEPGMAVKFIRIMAEDREVIKKYVHDRFTRDIVTELPSHAKQG